MSRAAYRGGEDEAHPSGHDFGRVVGIGQHPGHDQRNCAVCRRKSNDVQLQAAIEEAMRTSPLTANSLIVVHVNQGEVTLEGTAKNSLAQRERRDWPKLCSASKAFVIGWASSILKLPWSHRKSNCHTIPLPVLGHVPPRARESTSTATRFCAIEWTRGATKPRRKETP